MDTFNHGLRSNTQILQRSNNDDLLSRESKTQIQAAKIQRNAF